ncbi:hypothetical protein [Streptomyces mirabilis]|uniref:hypothetical protein n=1 Tax=Streptomyces mirabilis TaxID=68239 RepID=UPI00331CE6F1
MTNTQKSCSKSSRAEKGTRHDLLAAVLAGAATGLAGTLARLAIQAAQIWLQS